MPGPKKFSSFGKLGEFLKKQELEAAGKKFVDAGANAAKGTRNRVGTGVIKITPAKTQKVTVLQTTPVELPTFKPYYIGGENPNVLTPEQQELKDYLIKSRQIDLTRYQRDLANRGINTSASHRKAGAMAVATDPNAIMAPQEGIYKLPYQSATQMYEGAPLSEWFDLASQGMLPYGPNALWRKWYQSLHDATHSFDILGQNARGEAPDISLQQLGEGLKQMGHYLGMTPPRKPYISPLTTIRNPYVTPETNVVSNFIGPDMGPGIYGYHVPTNEWWPLTKRAADSAVGNIDKYSMFSTIGKGYRLSGKVANRHNIIERGVNFEGEPFVVRSNKHPELYKFNHGPGSDYSGPADWANSGSGSWKVKGYEQGGILLAKSGIHIKKKNRGKFTSWCGGKVTSECIARGKRSSNPAIRKRATFAANSRKWAKKHDSGGKFLNWWRRES